MKPIPYGRQDISEEDVRAVVEVLKSDFLTTGPAVERFEKTVANYCGAKYAVAVTNATAALHLACLTLDLGKGDTLWTSPNTFVASANCALYCGANIDFVDIDPRTYNMSVPALIARLEQAERTGSLPKVVVPVHFSGQSCDMPAFAELAHRYKFALIEDASHAIGSSYCDEKTGSGKYSDMTVFSFHPVKIVTSGEGGMILTNNEKFYQKLIRLRSHGITRDPAQMTYPPAGPWYYEQIELGYNYRITDIQAALGNSQMSRVDDFVQRRRELVKRYDNALSSLPLRLPYVHEDAQSAWHLYVIRLDASRAPITHRQLFEKLLAEKILANLHYIPVHLQPYYRKLGFTPGQFPEAEKYYTEAVSLPMYASLTFADQDRVIATLHEALA